MPWCSDGCPSEIASSPGIIDCPYCGSDLIDRPASVSSQPTLDALEIDDENTPSGVLCAALEAQVWGPAGLDPVDERAFLRALPMVGPLAPEIVREATRTLSKRVRAAAEDLLSRTAKASVPFVPPQVRLLVKAPKAGHLYPLRVLVSAPGVARLRVEAEMPGVDGIHPVGSVAKRLPRGKAAVEFQVRTAGGAHRAVGSLRITLWDDEPDRVRVYRADFRYEVEGDRHVVTSYQIHSEGIFRWNQHLAPGDGTPERGGPSNTGGSVDVVNEGKLTAQIAGGRDLKVANEGIMGLVERDPVAGSGTDAPVPEPGPEDLFVVPDLGATVAATIATEIEERTGPDSPRKVWLTPKAAPAHNAVLAWQDGSERFQAALLVGEKVVALGRHGRQSDIPVRPRFDVGNLSISRRAVETSWVGNKPRVRRIGASPVFVDDVALEKGTKADLSEHGQEVTWMAKPRLRWVVRVLRGATEFLPVRWHEPDDPGMGPICHVVAPSGGRLGGPADTSLLPLPNGCQLGPGVELLRRTRGWWLVGVNAKEHETGRRTPELLVDGRPHRHPSLRYGLQDGSRVRLPCGTEIEFHVGRCERPPDGDWEIRDRLAEGEPLHHLADLLQHIVHA